MARKTTFEELIILASKIPWQVNIILAPFSYFLFHWYAKQRVETIPGFENLPDNTILMMLQGLAQICQFFLPVLFILGALVSIFGRRKREKLYQKVEHDINALAEMSWEEFELLIGEYFRNLGFRVEETREGADGGVDLVVYRNNLKYLVQCKHWKANVGVKIVRELLGVIVASGAAGGYVICSGKFTREAIKFAYENKISLLGKKELHDIISGKYETNITQDEIQIEPKCPKCGSVMIKRTARKGPQAGQEFWGCSKFPYCRGTRS